MRLSCAIRSHPRRSDLVNRLAARLGVNQQRIVWDRHNDSWDTGWRAWRAHDPDADWHLVIEDDALVCRDLLAALERALDYLPHKSVASLYLGTKTGNSGILRTADRADEVGASWIRSPSLAWGVAIAAPVSSIDGMLTWCDRLTCYSHRVYDTRVANYYADVLRWPAYFTWPSLVDHAPEPSLLDHTTGRQARRFIGETASAHVFNPDGEVLVVKSRRTRQSKEHPVSELLVAKTNAVVQYRGRRVVLRRGATIAERDADIVRDRPALWEPLRVDFPGGGNPQRPAPPVEQATAAPGEKRDVDIPSTRKVREWAKDNGYDVPDRGKLPAHVIDDYEKAHGDPEGG